jgi:cathepsin B
MAAATHPINDNIVKAINANASWKAHSLSENPLKEYTHEQLLNMLGTYIVPSNKIYEKSPIAASIPASFDARTEWGSKIHAIRDQGQCGACWAFGATESLSDRFAIAGTDVILSPEDMVSCDTSDYGCGGGYMENAWEYLVNTGVVTESCFKYTAEDGSAPACASKCDDGSAMKKYKSSNIVHPQSVDEIKSELLNGPVEGAFTVYEDFFNYKSGVYHYVSGGIAGGHAIKVLGYGNEDNMDYWLCANSWGPAWGESGFFKIKQGDCGINDQIYAGKPALNMAIE